MVIIIVKLDGKSKEMLFSPFSSQNIKNMKQYKNKWHFYIYEQKYS